MAIIVLSLCFSAYSQTENWTPGGGSGGSGVWDTTTVNWDGNGTWTNGDDAEFGGGGGTVTVSNVTTDALTFDASGPYLLQSGTVTVADETLQADSAVTIASTLDVGADLEVTGAGSVTLTGDSSVTSGGSFGLFIENSTLNMSSGADVSD